MAPVHGSHHVLANTLKIQRHRHFERSKSFKQQKNMINIAEYNGLTPYPKNLIVNKKYFVYCDGGRDSNNAIVPPTVKGKPPRVISMRNGHLKVIDSHFSSDSGLLYKLGDNTYCDIIMPPLSTSRKAMKTKPSDAKSLFIALEDVEKHYGKSFSRGNGQVIALDEGLEVCNYYVCAGTYPNRCGGGISPYNVAFAKSNPSSQNRIMKLFKNVEYLFNEWIDARETRIAYKALKLVNGKTFTLPSNPSNKSALYGAFASGK